MIALLIILYMFFTYALEMPKEDLLKIMLALIVVNLVPVIIYVIYSMLYGELNIAILIIMAIV
jgi:hypothetical protein